MNDQAGPMPSGVVADPVAAERARRKEIRIVYIGLMMVMGLASLDQSIVATALPRIVSDLGGVQQISWVVTAYILTSTVTMPLYGKLSDEFGRKPLIYAAVLIFLGGSMLAGLSQSMPQLIFFRALQGLGAGGLMPLMQITIGDLVPPRERGKYQGNMAIVFALSNVSGPALGGIITEALSWHWIFYINLPLGLLALFMIGVALKRPHVRVKRKIDYLGASLLTVSATAFLLLMSLGGTEFAWLSLQSLTFAVLGIVFGIAFVWRERTADEPLLPLSLFKNKTFLIGSFVLACMFLSTQGANIFYPLFFQVVNGIAATKSGLLTVPLPLGMLVAARFNGRLMMKTGRYKPSQLFGVSLAVISFVLLTWATATGQSLWVIEPILACVGLSLGSTMPGMQVAVQSAVERENMGVAMATMTFFRSLGGVLGVALSGLILTHSLAAQAEATVLPAGTDVHSFLNAGIIQINAFPPALHALAISFYRHAIAASFSTGIVATALAFIALLFLPEVELGAADATTRGGPSRNAGRPGSGKAMPPPASLAAE